MGRVLHGSATTTEAVRRAIQYSQASLRTLSKRYGINQKAVAKWRQRTLVADQRMGPKDPRSTVLSHENEAVVIASHRHTLLPLDDCLYALQATISHLTRSALHRCLQRHGISRLPEIDGDKPKRSRFKTYPLGYFHIDLAEVHTAEGRLYRLIEEGEDEPDDLLKELLSALQAERDLAKAALGRIREPGPTLSEIDPELIGHLMRDNVTSGEIPFRKARLQAIVDRVEV